MQNKCHTCKNTQLDYKFTTIDYITEEEFKIFECKTCNLLFPDVYPKNLDNYYPKQYRSYSKIVSKILSIKSNLFVRKIDYFFKKNITNKKILEIGCGKGIMLNIFKKKGWEVYGKEREEYIEKNDQNITNKPIEMYKNEAFECILLYNSLEHLKYPHRILNNLTTKLKKGGLIIITVPSYKSWQFQLGKQDWLHLDTPRHLSIFSKNFFFKYIRRNKRLKIISQKNIAIDLKFYGWFQTILNKFSKKNNYFFKFLMGLENNKKLFFLGLLQLTILSIPIMFLSILSMIFNRGSTMQVILKKI